MTDFKLWVDKYKPTKLDNFTYNRTAAKQFLALSQKIDIPHLIVKGISGIGKKSMVMAYIQKSLENYGLNGQTNIFKTQNIVIPLKYPSKSIDLHVQKSLYHYNVNPSDYNIYDRHIVQDFLKNQFKFKNLTGFPFKYVIIRNAEKLSDDAQQSLRRTLESRIHNCRFIFMINTENRGGLIPPLNSRCIHIRMSAPTKEEAIDVVNKILAAEGFNANDNMIANLYRKCQYNLTRTINMINLLAIKSPQLLQERIVHFPSVDPVAAKLHEIIQLFNAQTFQSIVQIRSILYVLLAHGVRPENIIKRLFRILIHNLKGYETEIIELTSDIESMLNKSSREFYHLENYIIGLMVMVKNYKPTAHASENKPTLNLTKAKEQKKNEIKSKSKPTTSKPTTSKSTTSGQKISKSTTSGQKISKSTTSGQKISKSTTSESTTSEQKISKPKISKPKITIKPDVQKVEGKEKVAGKIQLKKKPKTILNLSEK